MASAINVLLSFTHGRLRKLIDFGREHAMQNRQGNLKNATVAMNIVEFILELRHDPVFSRMLEAEKQPILPYIKQLLTQQAAKKGYFRSMK